MKRIFAFVILLLCVAGCDCEPPAIGEDLHGAWAYSQIAVEKHLKSPSRAKFEFGAVANGAVVHIGNDVYQVNSYVDSSNAFGAIVRTYFALKIRRLDNGERWKILGDIAFEN